MRFGALHRAVAVLLTALPVALQAQGGTSAASALDSLLRTPISAASRYAQTAAEAPASMTILTSEELQRYGYRTVGEALERVPSFYLSNDRNYTYVGVRGFGRPTDYNNRILLLLNGYSQNETFYGGGYVDRAMGIELTSVDHIEIARGPASAVYGSYAMFAVINIVTVDGAQFAHTQARLEGGPRGQAEGAVTYGGSLRGISTMLAANIGTSNGENIYFPEFDTPANNHGVARGLDREHWQSVMFTASRGGFSLQAGYVGRRKEIPTGAWGTEFNAPGAWTNDASGDFGLAYRRQVSPNLAWTSRAHAGSYNYHGRYPGDPTEEDRNVGLWTSIDGQLVWDAAPNHRVSVGGEVVGTSIARYATSVAGRDTYNRTFPYTMWGAYVSDEYELFHGLTLVSGLRVDGHSELDDSFTPRLALIASPNDATTVKLLWGRAFRQPTVYEAQYSDSIFLKPTGLSPEWIRTTELVVERRLGSASWATVSLFDNRVDGLIDTKVNDATGHAQFANVGETRARGVELNARVMLPSDGSAYVGVANTRAVSGDGERLTNSPRTQFMAGFSQPVRGFGQLALEGRLEDSRRTLLGDETTRAVVVNAQVTTRPLWKGVTLTARVLNALDANWKVPGGVEHVQDQIPQPRRTAVFGARLRW